MSLLAILYQTFSLSVSSTDFGVCFNKLGLRSPFLSHGFLFFYISFPCCILDLCSVCRLTAAAPKCPLNPDPSVYIGVIMKCDVVLGLRSRVHLDLRVKWGVYTRAVAPRFIR